jgi:hypothetical protein
MASLFVALAVVVAGLAVVYLLLRSRIDRSIGRLDPAAEIRDELGSVMVEMNRTTDRNIALLEDRIACLTQLLAEADRKVGLLRREGEKHETSRRVYTHLARAAADRPAEEPMPRQAPGQRDAAVPPPAPEEPLEARVLRLEREGFSAAVIANRVGSTVGEVELIISLARRRP